MRGVFILLILISGTRALAQANETTEWPGEISTSFSYGSENNIGNPGFMLITEYERMFKKNLSASGRIGFFYSMPWFALDDDFLSYSCLTAGIYLSHTARFAEERNYVRVSGGVSYIHSTSIIIPGNNQPTIREVISKFGYGLSLEGGRFISKHVGLGGILHIFSYQIFGDITVLGVNARFRL